MHHLGKRFGDFHQDEADSPAVPSSLVFAPHLPPTYDPGAMYLPEIGIAVPFSQFGSMNLSGRHMHASRPPRPKPGTEPVRWACRVMAVHYSHDVAFNGTAVIPICPLRAGERFYPFSFRPEMQRIR